MSDVLKENASMTSGKEPNNLANSDPFGVILWKATGSYLVTLGFFAAGLGYVYNWSYFFVAGRQWMSFLDASDYIASTVVFLPPVLILGAFYSITAYALFLYRSKRLSRGIIGVGRNHNDSKGVVHKIASWGLPCFGIVFGVSVYIWARYYTEYPLIGIPVSILCVISPNYLYIARYFAKEKRNSLLNALTMLVATVIVVSSSTFGLERGYHDVRLTEGDYTIKIRETNNETKAYTSSHLMRSLENGIIIKVSGDVVYVPSSGVVSIAHTIQPSPLPSMCQELKIC